MATPTQTHTSPLDRGLNYLIWRIERVSKGISRQGLYEFLDHEFARIAPSAQVLTVGAGGPVNERLQRYAEQRPFGVTSFDIDPARNPDLVGDLCTYDFEPEAYDAIILSEVLEHVHTPHLALENLYRTLRPGGRLVVTTPFLFPLHNRPRDYYRYTRYGLEHLLRRFDQVQVTERNSWAGAINVLLVRHYKEADTPSKLLAPFLTALAYLQQPIAYLLGRLAPNDFMTTGYNTTAVKGRSASANGAVPMHRRRSVPA